MSSSTVVDRCDGVDVKDVGLQELAEYVHQLDDSDLQKVYLREQLAKKVSRVVGKVVDKYVVLYPALTHAHDFDDLVNECFLVVFKKLDKYHPERCRFTTWVWRVCLNRLNTICRYNLRKCRSCNTEMVPIDSCRGLTNFDIDYSMQEVRGVLCDIMSDNPSKGKFLEAMFGKFTAPDWVADDVTDVKQAAKESGITSREAKDFYVRVVKSYFRQM